MDVEYERSSPLYESERNIDRDPGATPFDLIGNISGLPFDEEIDPALFDPESAPSALVNPIPTVAGALDHR